MDEDTKSEGSGLVEIVLKTVAIGFLGLYALGSIKQRMIDEEKARRQEERDNTIYNCSSCGEDYRFGDSGSTSFCSDLCEKRERGSLVTCEYCHKRYFENEGYNSKFCSRRCYDDEY